jgi:hypothetical protein
MSTIKPTTHHCICSSLIACDILVTSPKLRRKGRRIVAAAHNFGSLKTIDPPSFGPTTIIANEHTHDRTGTGPLFSSGIKIRSRCAAERGRSERLEAKIPRFEISLLKLVRLVWIFAEGFYRAWEVDLS